MTDAVIGTAGFVLLVIICVGGAVSCAILILRGILWLMHRLDILPWSD
jgi:hypothetical protein